MKLRDLTGQVFGKLTVKSRAPDKVLPGGYKVVRWNCDCECGKTTIVSSKSLLYAKYPTRSCGCGMYQIKNNLVGKRFGRLLVVEKVKGKILKSGYEQQTYKCICDCGNETILPYSSLTTGNTSSCGCLFNELTSKRMTTHGMSKTKLYDVWLKMRHRCFNEKDQDYEYYGERGIKVCDEWNEKFESFYEWSNSNGYKEGLTIDRINVNGDYEPSNCRWVNREVQMNNTRANKILTIQGISHTMAEWSKMFGKDQETLRDRLLAGWDEITALTAPTNYRYRWKGKYEYGEKLFSDTVRC